MNNRHDSEIERFYRDITNGAVDVVMDDPKANDFDNSHVLMQIMYNLAHIADELRALRKVEEKFLEESEEYDGEESEESEKSVGEQKSEDAKPSEETKNKTCMFCGKELDDPSGILVVNGESYCTCDKCVDKLEKLSGIFIE